MEFFGKQVIEKIEGTEIILSISRDFMKAYLMIKNEEKIIGVNKEFILNFLKNNNINYGIDENKIDSIIKTNRLNSSIEIAKGQMATPGQDAIIKYYFDKNRKVQPKVDESGKINFKEIDYIENIKSGQVLAEKIEAKEGVDGINIFGEKVKANKGKDVKLKNGKNTNLSEDKLKVLSSCDGRIEFRDGKIEINTVLDIKGCIDASTGNIRFNGDIRIQGDIQAGFLVESDGNIEVSGVIEDSSVKAKGNLIVKGGIQGHQKETIYCGGNLICKYIENAKIHCDGDIITDFIVHSHIICQNKLNVTGKRGLIAGGNTKVRYEVKANIIGSHMGTKTYIEVGVNPNLKNEKMSNIVRKEVLEKKLKSISEKLNYYSEFLHKGTMDIKMRQTFMEYVEEYKENSEELDKIKIRNEHIQKEIYSAYDGVIIVTKKVFSGVKISIGNYKKNIEEEINGAKFFIDNNDIVIRNL